MKLFKALGAFGICAFMAACGGGGGSSGSAGFGAGAGTGAGGTTLPVTPKPTVVLSISSTTVTSNAPATVTATVKDAAGIAAPGQVIAFSTAGNLGGFTPSTALTDLSGTASVRLSPASSTLIGADLVIARVTVAATQVSGSIGFQVIPVTIPTTGTPSISVTLSSTTITSASPGNLRATLKDGAGVVVVGQVVKFQTTDGLGVFSVPSALTDASGSVEVRLSPTTTTSNGADLAVVQASVNGIQVSGSVGFSVTATGAPLTGNPSIQLSLSTTTVTTAAPATVTAQIRGADGNGLVGQVVKFSTVDGLGTLSAASALTDATGFASTSLSAATSGTSGADQVIARATVNATPLQASQGFQLTASSVSIASFSSDAAGLLSAYGQTNLTVALTGQSPGSPVNVTVSSVCVAKGKATLTPAMVTTTTGIASFTYRDAGCGATDRADTLQVSTAGSAVTAALSIPLSAPDVSSITFVSASPQSIFLKGSGYAETSTVVFRVVDNAGNGLPNQIVTLDPSTLTGGLTIDGSSASLTKQSDAFGNVTVIVNSGTVPTPVRVRAKIVTPPPASVEISTVSSSLSIAVGLPSQLNFSLSQSSFNVEGGDIDGSTNTYSIIASDRLGNPIPVGTAINFITEGGQVEPVKFTTLVGGLARASANFVSSSPRPADGRITVLAYALGEESFLDAQPSDPQPATTGNNKWDAGEPFQDLGAVYLSRKFDGIYDSSSDQLIPLTIPGAGANAACVPNGPPTSLLYRDERTIPSVAGNTCDGTWGRAYVRRAIETVLSTSVARPVWLNAPAGLVANPGATCPLVGPLMTGVDSTGVAQTASFYQVGNATTIYGVAAAGVITFIASDRNTVRLNPLAAGSTISVVGTVGLTATLIGGSPVPSSLTATSASVRYQFSAGTSAGAVSITTTSPSGVVSTVIQSISTDAPGAGVTSCP